MFGWISEPDQLFLAEWLPVVAADYPFQPMCILEVGTFAGSTARGLVAMTGGGQIWCVDDWSEVDASNRGGHESGRAYWEATIRYGTDLSAFATLIEGHSWDVGMDWKLPIDLLFLDASRHRDTCLTEMRLFGQHVVPGGHVLVDDWDVDAVAFACARYFREGWEVVREPDWRQAKLCCYRRSA